jgi:hypothetical protein
MLAESLGYDAGTDKLLFVEGVVKNARHQANSSAEASADGDCGQEYACWNHHAKGPSGKSEFHESCENE